MDVLKPGPRLIALKTFTNSRKLARRLFYFAILGSVTVTGCTNKRSPISVSRPVVRMPSFWSTPRSAPLESPSITKQAPPPVELPAPEFSGSEALSSPSDALPPERSPPLNRAPANAPSIEPSYEAPIELNPQASLTVPLRPDTPPSLALQHDSFDAMFELPYAEESGRVRPVAEVDVAQAMLIGSGIPAVGAEYLSPSCEQELEATISAENANIHATSALPPTLQEVAPGKGVWR